MHFFNLLWFRILEKFRFYFSAKTKYKIHSPFVYQWVDRVIESGMQYYAFGEILALRQKIATDTSQITITDFGAGPSARFEHTTVPQVRVARVSDVLANSSSSTQQGEMLFRMAQMLQPQILLELGTNLGIGTLYMAKSAGKNAKVFTLEGCPALAQRAKVHFDLLQCTHVEVITGPFEQTLKNVLDQIPSPDWIYLDGNHTEAATLQYFEICLPKRNIHTVVILDDVHWSPGMKRAWENIKKRPEVTLTIDCGDFACVFFNPDFVQKQHFKVIRSIYKPFQLGIR